MNTSDEFVKTLIYKKFPEYRNNDALLHRLQDLAILQEFRQQCKPNFMIVFLTASSAHAVLKASLLLLLFFDFQVCENCCKFAFF